MLKSEPKSPFGDVRWRENPSTCKRWRRKFCIRVEERIRRDERDKITEDFTGEKLQLYRAWIIR